jgi:hypothetical protein
VRTIVEGPYLSPGRRFGKPAQHLNYNYWYIRRLRRLDEPSPLGLPDVTLGTVVNYLDQPKRYIIRGTWPIVEFSTLEECARYLLERNP